MDILEYLKNKGDTNRADKYAKYALDKSSEVIETCDSIGRNKCIAFWPVFYRARIQALDYFGRHDEATSISEGELKKSYYLISDDLVRMAVVQAEISHQIHMGNEKEAVRLARLDLMYPEISDGKNIFVSAYRAFLEKVMKEHEKQSVQ